MSENQSTRIILIPTYNEASNIQPLYTLIRGVCDWDILFIDDTSPDGTSEIIKDLATMDPRVHLLQRERREGLGNAYRCAYRYVAKQTRWKKIFMMDADLSHQPSSLPELDSALDDSDLALGSRYLKGVSVLNWSIIRLNISFTANWYIRLITGMSFSDCTSGFRGFRSELIPILLSSGIKASGYAFLVETLHGVWKRKCRIKEVPIVFMERNEGDSKVSARVFWESLITPVRLVMKN